MGIFIVFTPRRHIVGTIGRIKNSKTLQIGFAIRNAVATLGYEWHATDWTVRASMDSDGLVGCTLHRSFPGTHANFGCAFSALLNHPNDKFRMGFGITATLI